MANSIGYLFPGQGAQIVGMGKDLVEQFPTAKKLFDEADAILGYKLSDICFNGPDEKLTQTIYAQPAIFVMSLAALAVFKEKNPDLKPAFVAGLSLGEFTALVAGDAITFEQGLKLVDVRARAMEECAQKHQGTMASVMGLTEDVCESIAKEAGCQVANLNAPDQTVLTGKVDTVEAACKLAQEKGAKRAMILKVGGAFHSELMMDAKQKLEEALRQTDIVSPNPLFVSNAAGKRVSSAEEIRTLLASQLVSSVQWTKTMKIASEQSIPLYLEVGPGKVLKGLARKSATPVKVECIGTVGDFDKVEQLLNLPEAG